MTDRRDMTKRRFARLIRAYGANPSHWPENERAAARQHLARHGMPAPFHAEHHIDHWLETAMPAHVPASDAFLNRLLAISQMPQAAGNVMSASFGRIGPGILLHILSPIAFPARAAALVLALAAGLWVGTTGYDGYAHEAVDLSPWLVGYDLAFYKDTSP